MFLKLMKVCLILKSTNDVISNILLNINYNYVHVFCNKSFCNNRPNESDCSEFQNNEI